MIKVIVPLPNPSSDVFQGAFASLIHQINDFQLSYSTIRQYLRAIFTCAIKYNHSQSISYLFQLSWFETRLYPCIDILEKLLKWYRGKGKQSIILCYTLLLQNFINSENQINVIKLTLKLLQNRCDHNIFINILKENFPHKNRPLEHHQKYMKAIFCICENQPCLRQSLLQIILQQLSTFDTEIKAGDNMIHRPFFDDCNLLSNEKQLTDMEIKLEHLIILTLDFIGSQPQIQTITQQLLLVFHRKILLMSQNKYIQYIVFFVSQSKKQVSGYFLSILINTLFQQNQVLNRKTYINNLFYLGSYLVRARLSDKRIKKALKQTIQFLKNILSQKSQLTIQSASFDEIVKENEYSLYIYQTIIFVLAQKPRIYKNLQEQFNNLSEIANKKICADFLIKPQILNQFNKVYKRSQFNHIKSETQYLSFENKFNPILFKKLRNIIQPYYINHEQQILDDIFQIGKRKRSCCVQNKLQKKLKTSSDEHISQTSTIYNGYQINELAI